MAYVETKERRGGTPPFIVRWRAAEGRNGKRESQFFDDLPSAEQFHDLVRGHGEQWPPGWTKGEGFVADRRRKETMFEPFALAYVIISLAFRVICALSARRTYGK